MTTATTPAKRASGAALLAVMLLGVLAGGCAIRTRSARQIAYDDSDHRHYNRPHAPSPAYRSAADNAAARHQPTAPPQRYGVRDSGQRHPALGYLTTVLIPPPAAGSTERTEAEAASTGRRPTPVQAGRAPAPSDGRRAVFRRHVGTLPIPSR